MERSAAFQNKAVLVTGGTGTIGSEIVRQLLRHSPRVVRIYSRDESKQAELRMDLPESAPVRFLLGDVRDRDRLACALESVDVVFHAAALKHVPACEYNPFEAVQTNVNGTQNLILASRDAGVKRLVFVSTDKAVNPSNTMGATKLLGENLVRASQEWNSRMVLCTVRFGNVLGSRGSLLPSLVRQMEKRRRVDLTSNEMTRFMMTIQEAVTLLLDAACQSRGGELFILKMPALAIGDLIEVFVEEYCGIRGWNAESIETRVVGVRPGEKVHEELVTREECGRLVELPHMYVVQPSGRVPTTPRSLPADCHSGRAPRIDRDAVRELLERSGILAEIRSGSFTPDAVEEPML